MNLERIGILLVLTLSIFLIADEVLCAEWQRRVYTPKGDWIDATNPHPLGYFVKDPFLRDDGNDFCISCTPAEKSTIHQKMKFKTEVRPIGKLNNSNIFDVYYWFGESGVIRWKSILVETAKDEYREIYHLQPTSAEIGPSYIFKIGAEEILGTRDRIPGTGALYYEEYWWFDNAGPIRLDTAPIHVAAKSILPKGGGIWKGYGLNMRSLDYRMPVWMEGDTNAEPTGGKIDIKFKIVKGSIIVTEKHYTPPR